MLIMLFIVVFIIVVSFQVSLSTHKKVQVQAFWKQFVFAFEFKIVFSFSGSPVWTPQIQITKQIQILVPIAFWFSLT